MLAKRVDFLGCQFDCGSLQDVARDILDATQGSFRYVMTPNVHDMVRWLENPATIAPLYRRAWRILCDSRVLSRLAWFSGRSLPVVTGSDLTAHLVECAAQQSLTIALIGPTHAASEVLRSRYPGLRIELHTPPMGFIASQEEVRKCVEFAVKTRAPLTFLALGMPQQAILAHQITDHPQAQGIGLCIGASIDFLTGRQRRAPIWLQKLGLEWLHRLLSDPRRLAARYLLECPRIFYLIVSRRAVREAADHV